MAADSIVWNKEKDRVSADVHGWPLERLLKHVAAETGWQVYVEPDTTNVTSAKFSNLPPGDALRMLLGDLNFAVMPQTNSRPHLYVFRTAMNHATQLVKAVELGNQRPGRVRPVPNELIVRVKPGVDIDALAHELGARVVGRIPELNAYRLQFDDQAAADAARNMLANNSDVSSVENNYYVDPAPNPRGVTGITAATPQLQLKPPPGSGRVVVGLVDTAVQPLGNGLDDFVTKRLSVNGDGTANSDTPMHGTTMAWDILSSLNTVTQGNSAARLISVNVFGADGQTTTFNVAEGIITAVNNGANILNLSLGSSGDSSLLRDTVSKVAADGIGMIGAAGNQPTGEPVFPAGYTGVMPVTALQGGRVAPYANVWGDVQVAAPGASVMNYDGQTFLSQGTSVSTAITTGIAAGLKETTGQSWSQVQAAIRSRFPVPSK